jgi:drug/metabolite transporter (DMT)-like permease
MNALVKSLSPEIPIIESAFFRCLFAVAVLTPWLRSQSIPLLGNNRKLLFVRGLFGFLSLVLGFYAISGLRLADASILWKTAVIFTAIFGVIFLKERISLRMSILICLGLLGSALIIKPSLSVLNVPGLAGIGGGMALGVVACSIRGLQKSDKSWTIVYAFSFWSALLSLLFVSNFVFPSFQQLVLLVFVGITGLIGQFLYTEAFRFAAASFVQPFSFAEVLFSAVIGALMWGEIPDQLAILGGILILTSGILLLRTKAT